MAGGAHREGGRKGSSGREEELGHLTKRGSPDLANVGQCELEVDHFHVRHRVDLVVAQNTPTPHADQAREGTDAGDK